MRLTAGQTGGIHESPLTTHGIPKAYAVFHFQYKYSKLTISRGQPLNYMYLDSNTLTRVPICHI
jgi:hypothetical protein